MNVDVVAVIARLASTADYRRAQYTPDGRWFRDVTGELVIRKRTAGRVAVPLYKQGTTA